LRVRGFVAHEADRASLDLESLALHFEDSAFQADLARHSRLIGDFDLRISRERNLQRGSALDLHVVSEVDGWVV
jgi:hypothetical protein